MRKVLILPLLFIVAVIGIVAALFLLYVPVETEVQWSENGIFFDNSSAERCALGLGGTLTTYRMDTKPPYFSSNPYSRREGIFLDGTQVFNRLSFNFPKDNSPIRFRRSGLTLFTDREFSFAVVIFPTRDDRHQIAIAPAATEAEARAVLQALLSDPRTQTAWTTEAAILQSFLFESENAS